MEALITIIIIFLFVGFLFRHLGKYLLPFLMRRMARKFGMDSDAFRQNAQQANKEQSADTQSEPEQVIPDSVGEYVDFEEIK